MKKLKIMFIIFIAILGFACATYASTPTFYSNDIKYNNAKIDMMNIRLFGMQTEFDLRDEIALKVKNQGNTSYCWAFSTTTVLESYLALNEDIITEYSPRHIEYATSKTFLDGINENGYNREIDGGGNSVLAFFYILSGRGPVLESQMPFTESKDKINLSEVEEKAPDKQLEEIVYFPKIYKKSAGDTIVYTNGETEENMKIYTDAEVTAIRNTIKSHIIKYGGVTAYTNATEFEYYSNPENIFNSNCYYCDDTNIVANHQVTIVGWDDNYPVSNFNEEHRPSKPGAYLVLNSYGADKFEEGYMYISYEDILIETEVIGITRVSEIDYDNIYQYDPLGINKTLTTNSTEITGANVYKKSSEPELLKEIGFYPISGCTYEIYVNSQDGNLENVKKVATVGEKENVLYTTVTLDTPICLTGTEFVVAVRYLSDDVAELPVECINGFNSDDFFNTASSNRGESFICAEESLQNWIDTEDVSVFGMEEINVCVKSFTENFDESDVYVYSDSYTISDKITGISPNTTVKEFKEQLITNGTVKVVKGTNELTDNDTIGTNCKVRIVENNAEYSAVVLGDINGDGKLTTTDLLKLKRHIIKLEEIAGIFLEAADINKNNSITTTDLLQIKQAIVGIISL